MGLTIELLDYQQRWRMLIFRVHRVHGFSLIELMITIVILGIGLALAAPSFSLWIQSSRIRTMAGSISNGLSLAKAEAVRRNAPVSLVLSTSTNPGSWAVSTPNPASTTESPLPVIAIQASGTENTTNLVVTADKTTLTFNSLGRATSGKAAIEVQGTSGTCATRGGSDNNDKVRCLKIEVSAGGQIRQCDPALPVYPDDAQGCST